MILFLQSKGFVVSHIAKTSISLVTYMRNVTSKVLFTKKASFHLAQKSNLCRRSNLRTFISMSSIRVSIIRMKYYNCVE